MTCGVRNDFTNPSGFCQNGHDNWLEYYDVINKNQFFKLAVEQSGMNEDKFTAAFMDYENKFISQANFHNKVLIEMRGGVIQRIIANVPVAYTIIDYDEPKRQLGVQKPDQVVESISSLYESDKVILSQLRLIRF